MKKLYLTAIITMGVAAGAMAQGTVNFSNFPLADYVTIGPASPNASSPTNTAAVGTYMVELLFASGSSTSQAQGSFTVVDTYTPNVSSSNGPGYFSAGTVTVAASLYGGGAGGSGVFEVEGIGLGQYAGDVGLTAEFVNNMGNPLPPPTIAQNLTGWNGSLVIPVPEPSVMILSGLGAAAMLLYRRKK